MANASNGLFKDVLIGAIGGLIGTVVLERISSTLYEREDAAAKKREDDLRKDGDPPMQLAKRVAHDVLRLDLSEENKGKLATGIHYSVGAMAGALFGALAPRAPFLSAGLGTAYGTLFWLVADEIGMPVMGLSRTADRFHVHTSQPSIDLKSIVQEKNADIVHHRGESLQSARAADGLTLIEGEAKFVSKHEINVGRVARPNSAIS